MTRKFLKFNVSGMILLLFSLTVNAASLGFNKIYVFGDSLSDTGNVFNVLGGAVTAPPYTSLIPGAAYASGRLTNGPVWVEHLASKLGLDVKASLEGGTGYAFGGAGTGPSSILPSSFIPTLTDQAQLVANLFPGALESDALYVVWGGGNDVRDAVATGSPSQVNTIIGESLNNIGGVISLLAAEGATQFLVPNLPDLGLIPAVRQQGTVISGFFSQATDAFNNNLTSVILPGLQATLGIDITQLDVDALIDSVILDSDSFGITNVTDACIQVGGGDCSNPDEYLFWDGLHPTTVGHSIIGEQAYAALVPVPAAFPLFVAALSILGFRVSRASHLV